MSALADAITAEIDERAPGQPRRGAGPRTLRDSRGAPGANQPQHLRALERANSVRLDAAQLRREVAAGRLTLAAALEDPRAQSLTLMRLLTAQRRWGAVRARRMLDAMPCSELLRVRDMTGRQRERAARLAALTQLGLRAETRRARTGLA